MCSLVTCSLVWERLKANARIWPQPLSFLVMLVGPHFHRVVKTPEFFCQLKLSKSFLFHLSRDSFASYLSEDAMALQDGSAQLVNAPDKKYMITNIIKTFYLHLSSNPVNDEIKLPGGQTIKLAHNGEHL